MYFCNATSADGYTSDSISSFSLDQKTTCMINGKAGISNQNIGQSCAYRLENSGFLTFYDGNIRKTQLQFLNKFNSNLIS